MAPNISLEFFPPQNLEGSFRLWDTIHALAPLEPRFVSVTYGAGGTTRDLTRDAVRTINKATGLSVAAHLTCVDATRAETLAIAEGYAAAGVTEIVALRGDPPKGAGRFEPHPQGFAHSVELIEALAATGKFNIRVGAYPDVHPEARNARADIDWLKAKLDAGADEAITQFFFEADTFLRFRDACAKAGIENRIVPGVLPISNWARARRFAVQCGTSVPDWLDQAFETAERDDRAGLLGLAVTTELCSKLTSEGCEHLHVYTLNSAALTEKLCTALGAAPAPVQLRNVA